ncbi:hypothetical protein B4U80_00166, partial [Leptotrombidium deliense]
GLFVDEYIQLDNCILLLNAILQKTSFYRHILLNCKIPGNVPFKLMVVFSLSDAYRKWSLLKQNPDTFVDLEFTFYLTFVKVVIENVLFYLFTYVVFKLFVWRTELKDFVNCLIVCSYGKLFNVPAVIYASELKPIADVILETYFLLSLIKCCSVKTFEQLSAYKKMSKLFGSLSRHYHSKIGVYGYKPLNKVFGEQVTRENVLNGHLKHASLYDVVKEFREKGHYLAQIDPLCLQSAKDSTNKTYLLNEYLKKFENDESIVSNNNFIYNGKDTSSVKELIEFLKKTYCGTIGVEFMHISDLTEREWFTQKWEQLNTNNVLLSDDQKKELAVILLKCQLFDNFVAAKYPTVKRYACEGAESMIVFFDELFKYSSTQHNITDVIIGMPHRGRLNLLTCLLNFPPRIVFRKMQGLPEFD